MKKSRFTPTNWTFGALAQKDVKQDTSSIHFGPKIEILKDFEDRVTDIMLKSKERTIKVGAFLNPDDKKSFASALSNALYRAKR